MRQLGIQQEEKLMIRERGVADDKELNALEPEG